MVSEFEVKDDLYNKEIYLIECEDFIFFPVKDRIVGIEISSEYGVLYITEKNKKIDIEEANRFKTPQEAWKEANRLNEIPKYKQRAERWNNRNEVMKRKYMKGNIFDEF